MHDSSHTFSVSCELSMHRAYIPDTTTISVSLFLGGPTLLLPALYVSFITQ